MKQLPKMGLAVIVVYLLLAIAFSQTLHFSRALDEGYHLEYITFIKQHGRLPISYQERSQITRADFPPLYHLMVTLLSARVRVDDHPNFKIFWDSFRYRAMDHQSDSVWTIETEDYQWPYFGRFLVWQIGRWFSIILSLTTVIVIFFTLQEIPLGQKPLLPLLGATLLAFIPRYIMLGSSLNDDNLLGLVAALYFWTLVKAINTPGRWWPFTAMGILLGVSMTVKYTLFLVPLEVVVVCGVIAHKKGLGWSWAWRRIGLVGGLMLLCSSWWFGWNIWFLNTVAQDGWLVGLLRPILAGGSDTTLNRISGFLSGGQVGLTDTPETATVDTFPEWIRATFTSFWGGNVPGSTPFSPYVYFIIGLILIIALFGLWRLWQTNKMSRGWLALLIFHTVLFVVIPLIRFGLTQRLGVAAQGRHILIPAATAVVALLVWGLAAAIPQRRQSLVFTVVLTGFFAWTGAHLYQLNALASAPLPLRTLPQAAEWLTYPAHIQFGDGIELVSYEFDPQPERGLLRVDLAWRSLSHVNESYLLNVSLINSQKEVVSHWTGYNGQGRLPSLTWDPGDVVFDRLVLPLPNLPADDYTLQVQVLSRAGPLVSMQGSDALLAIEDGNILSLANISLSEPSNLPLTRHMTITGTSDLIEIAFALWQIENPKSKIQNRMRYPATISIITSVGDLNLALIDADGQAWPAARSEANIHTFIIGPRWQSGEYRLQMTLQEDDEVIGQVVSEPLLVIENWWERQFDIPEIAVPSEANFANQLKFLGYKLPQNQVKAGEAFPLTLYWQALPHMSPQADFIQFNNFLDRAGTLWGGYDRYPLEYYNTLLWAPGEVVVDGYAVPIDVDAPPGEYYLNVGYYLTVGESAVNLPLVVDDKMTDVSSVTIGPIEVVAP